ncbi:uncharacterized protein LOC135401730 isoform X2 [Ornithodoros turicata]|uniref:uncharacterized protein LOC135401730 isoform X2 n=1 Tax=Ornithodoros turicata TaxID=34597 RepID=UPI00313A0DF5
MSRKPYKPAGTGAKFEEGFNTLPATCDHQQGTHTGTQTKLVSVSLSSWCVTDVLCNIVCYQEYYRFGFSGMIIVWLCFLISALQVAEGQSRRHGKVSPDLLVKAWQPFPSLEFAVDECVSNLNRTGRCLAIPDCRFSRGHQEGQCADGFGVCCVYEARGFPLATTANNSYFVQPMFPRPYRDSGNLSLTTLVPRGICQLRIELERFSISDPVNGSCTDDYFQAHVNGSDSILPRLCGRNDGQHLIVHLPISDERSKLTLKVSLGRSGFQRRWSIRIVQYKCGHQNEAPRGCLQYHTSCLGSLRSFAFAQSSPGSLQGLNYGVCIARPPWMQVISLKLDVLQMSGNSTQDCTDDFLQLPAGLTSNGKPFSRQRLCYQKNSSVFDIAVRGPLVFYVLTGSGAGRHMGFSISYNLFPCS